MDRFSYDLSDSRRIFNRSEETDSKSLSLCVAFDTAIASWRYVLEHGLMSYDDIHDRLVREARVLENELNQSGHAEWTTRDVTDNARLRTHAAYFEEMLLAPIIYRDPALKPERELLTNGAAAKSIDLMQFLFEFHDTPKLSNAFKMRLRGAINEQTALALFNFTQSSDRIAVPSSAKDDVLYGTDIELYGINDEKGAHVHRISVKTSSADAAVERKKYPDKIIISAADMQNTSLTTSRLLCRLYEGTPGLSNDEMQQLNYAQYCFQKAVDRQVRAENTRALPVPSETPQRTI